MTRRRLPGLRKLHLAVLLLGSTAVTASAAGSGESTIAELMERIELEVPLLLQETGVPGAAVSLVHDGRLVYSAGFGWADRETKTPVRPSTLFNVGSISKTLTAWGVMAAVEEGALDLGTPVADLLPDLPLLQGAAASGITLEQLLGHTSGLSTPSVPEYLPWERRLDLLSWLSSPESEIRVETPPGEDWSYSGAGYSVLQLLLERISGETFAAHMERAVLEPLGMTSSGFRPPRSGPDVARPYAEGERIPFRRYSGSAAAGLYTTSEDLARFLAAHSPGREVPAGQGVVSAASLERMREVNPLSLSPYRTGYGLGYDAWPLPTGEWSTGHRGQNHGWSALAWLSPDSRDGLVVVTNDSTGENLYRPVFCDWARWLTGEASFGRYCALDRDREPGAGEASPSPPGPALRELIGSQVGAEGPGLAALVARGEEVLFRGAFGASDLASGTELTPETPFYVASLAKPVTAAVVLDLVGDGTLALDDPVAPLLPELPELDPGTTVRHLLLHTSGVPDYWDLVDWRRRLPNSNAEVFERVRAAARPQSPPGGSFGYSNTGYLALASLAERVTGTPFATLVTQGWPGDPASSDAFVLEYPERDLPQRARGYGVESGESYLADYRRLEVPGRPATEPGFGMVGAGGLVSSLDGLYRWTRALLAGELLPPELTELALAPGPEATGLEGFGGTPRATLGGLLVNDVEGRRVVWQDGALFGHRSLLALEPHSETVVVLLANVDAIELRPLARQILELLE